MKSSKLRQLWTDEIQPCLPSLKLVDLYSSKKLTTVPDFRNALKLEILNLCYCENLEDIPDLSYLTKLVELNLKGCYEVRILRQLPPSLIKLNLCYTKMKKLENTSFQGLSLLKHLFLEGCKELESLPDNIPVLKNLKALDLQGCPKLSILPSFQMPIIIQGGSSPSENLPAARDGLRSLRRLYLLEFKAETLPCLKSLVSLEELYVQRSNVKSLPEDIKCLTNLWKIDVSECKNLRCIPELPPSLLHLDVSNCISLQKYTHFQSAELDLSQIDISKNYGRPRMQMMFMNCFSLEKQARNVIWRDLRLRNRSIIIPLFERGCDESWRWCSVGACTPGNQVPEWFKYSESGSRLQVNSKRLLHCPNGLYFFVVLRFPTNCHIAMRRTKITCIGYSESGLPFFSSCKFDLSFNDLNIKRTIVWYHHLGSHNNRFYLNGSKFVFLPSWLFVKCGVTPFYNNDHEGDNNHGYDDGNNDDEDVDYNNKVRQRGSSSSILLAEEEPGGACCLDLNFHVPAEEGQVSSGFDLNFSAPIEDELHLDLGLAPPAEERASLVERSQKRKCEHDQEEESRNHKRNS